MANPVTQEILIDLIKEIIDLGVDGIVLDVTDTYPNSGAIGFSGVSAHCFCEYCLDGLRLRQFTEPKEVFVGDEGLLRLVLRVDEDGSAHIDPTQDWIDQRKSDSLITLSLARKFVDGNRQSLEAEATRLLNYFRARVELTSKNLFVPFSCPVVMNIKDRRLC